MRIAFDLDDTLIPCRYHFPTERPFSTFFFSFCFSEKLRQGSQALLQKLHRQGHEIWIYTTSQRSSWYLKCWFRFLKIPLDGVVNFTRHCQKMRAYSFPLSYVSKYPPAFDIDILVDDSDGVMLEGQRYGFTVIHLNPNDEYWQDSLQRILDNINRNRVKMETAYD